ncbi:hypothetical protein [Cupriavidus oxalaticus]|uniref:Uncharacterized protein n=1 Tax=Cupriavidus oxalaticus TaxID=96344 RepID=A0A375FP40_9BURK|nr:hypothetical protein [Cupriavidus oxalaticus]QRQ85041.1 hypothetical protein JTE91_02865 [Cupriavidus oxalaticus]QRQ90871.1 hypothetical protein JTE92_09480 [Cupriavidus oxalaticus]WQD85400.1 hypothetical protein U0036_27605 [Cupriavidus oxalaticus]SPC07462.1 conserved hypothetical protein [Cupriavidus oxalaticus]SPC22038.1 conserved hypothetical protein [Cupriavidus oxalaticus]
MNTVNDLYRKRQGQSPTACPPEPCVCGTCGMLECLCRPRFFAGQVLTADDLNRLDGYIRGKHRLHNRQLHGWGVVNGLEVTCNPCGDGVAVGCGYALSPCGDDIVVCEAVSVDVCELIRRCKDAEHRWQQCEPMQHPPPQQCDAGEEEWILAIRYAEAPARGVKPLRPAPDCTANSCACGGNGGKCGCGGACGGMKCGCNGGGGNGATLAKPRGAPVQCEPTVICEGFAFEVYRKPPDKAPDPVGTTDSTVGGAAGGNQGNNQAFNPDSELMQRFRCCVELLVTQMPKLPGALKVPATAAEAQAWYQWLGAARMQLRRYFASHGSYNCDLMAQFNAIPYPAAGTLANAGAIYLAAVLLMIVWLDAMLACFCSALLPPCPAPTREVRVPLASLHIAGGCGAQSCRVLRVCNWTVHRKFATTFPSLQYWLGILPFGKQLRQLLENLCCFDIGGILADIPQQDNVPGAQPGLFAMRAEIPPDVASNVAPDNAAGNGNGNGGNGGNADIKLANAAYQRANDLLNPAVAEPERIAGATGLLRAALARTGKTLEFSTLAESMMLPGGAGNERDRLSAAESANLPQFVIANQLMRPAVSAALAPMLDAALGLSLRATAFTGAAPDTATPDAMAALRTDMDALRDSLKAQAAEIERLKAEARPAPKPATKRGGRKPG